MTEARNPWVTPDSAEPAPGKHRRDEGAQSPAPASRERTSRRRQKAPVSAEPVTPVTGPATPQHGIPKPARRLPSRPATPGVALWVVGAHGGAGESSLAELDERWAAAGHAWPTPVEPGDPCVCVLVARTNVRGLTAAQAALIQWAASDLAAETTLLGLVLIADAPGRLPSPLQDLAAHVRGGAPRTWELPWLEDWRLGEPDRLHTHRAVRRLVHNLHALTSAPAAAEDPRLASNETAATVDAAQTKGQEA